MRKEANWTKIVKMKEPRRYKAGETKLKKEKERVW